MNKQEPLLVDKVYIDIGCFERGCACASSNAQAGEDAECVAVVKHKEWVGLIRGVRVEGDTVIVSVKGGNEAARALCGALIEEMNK